MTSIFICVVITVSLFAGWLLRGLFGPRVVFVESARARSHAE